MQARKMWQYVMVLVLALTASSAWTESGNGVNSDGESIPPGESTAIAKVTELIRGSVANAANREGRAFRDAHRKHHGCARATFTVESQPPPQFAHGLFANASPPYRAWIRFSNGSGSEQDDHKGDGRGFAIKILGVDGGPRNLTGPDDETTSQDFLMINYPVFFVRNAEDYVGFQEAAIKGNPLAWFFPWHLYPEFLIAFKIQKTKMKNPLASTYYSMTPSKLGPGQMKFRVVPCATNVPLEVSDSADLLAENLTESLKRREACFEFQVQARTNPETMPIEDPTREWPESESPYVTVAKIDLPIQTPDRGEFCEGLSFTPWNGLADHRPLGGIQRARKAVYDAISRLRHEINGQPRSEPSP